jgi:UDPglucose 6-dehydrogenase
VVVHDPEASSTARSTFPTLSFADTVEEAIAHADAVLVLTEWPAFVSADPVALAALVDSPVVIDARNCLDADSWRAAGWVFRALGRNTSPVAATAITPGRGIWTELVGARPR